MIDAVIKVGGSLGRDDDRLRGLCAELADLGRRWGLLVIPGGGVFADAVRDLDARLELSRHTAHWAAIAGMDAYGEVLADLIPGATRTASLADAHSALAISGVAVLLPSPLLRREDPLPHGWEVTSDSIAAWIAREIDAGLLVLVKDAWGMAAPAGDGGQPPAGAVGRDVLRAWRCVDEYLMVALGPAPPRLWIVDGERPGRLRELLETGETVGVSLAE